MTVDVVLCALALFGAWTIVTILVRLAVRRSRRAERAMVEWNREGQPR